MSESGFDVVEAAPDATVDLGALPPGEASFLLLTNALLPLRRGQLLEVVSRNVQFGEDITSWCRLNQHEWVARLDAGDHWRILIRKGQTAPELPLPDWGVRLPLREGGVISVRDWLVGRAGEIAPRQSSYYGFVPRGAVAEPGVPDYGFGLNEKDAVWAGNLAALLEEAKAQQWNAATDIPWADLPDLPVDLERAVCQVMTFLAENEYSALYVPAKFLPRINAHYTEAVLFLATIIHDEARHIEVFTKRALANGGGLQYSAAVTEWSLQSLFLQEDYFKSSFLLHVLGEGTFLDLLSFCEQYAPDPVTRQVIHRARVDEGRHVAYGIAHVHHHLDRHPEHKVHLLQAAEERSEFLAATSGANPMMMQALAVLAGGGGRAEQVAEGLSEVKALYRLMAERRVARMLQIGLDRPTAEQISRVHTPNFM